MIYAQITVLLKALILKHLFFRTTCLIEKPKELCLNVVLRRTPTLKELENCLFSSLLIEHTTSNKKSMKCILM